MEYFDLNGENKDPIFALVYGPSGSGKTHFLGTLGELGTVLFIDIDKGIKTLQSATKLKPFLDNITVVDFQYFKDLDVAYKHVMANDPVKWNKLLKRDIVKKPFDWIVWDTWSEIQWFMMQELRTKENLTGTGIDFRKNIQIQHWGAMTDLNKLAIQELRKCPVNQVFTMQEVLIKDELSGQIFGGPAIHGKMVQEMPVFFDVVAYTYVNLQGKQCLSTKPKQRWTAKTRLKEGAEYADPTAKEVFSF